ncbi:MAG: hypothetical protein A2Y88_05895 [Chloroflexi bacterium RBG_13_48_10]|nr:MAG: hypothetical protein A2Y88_05895 [Chloroflexi bacterium RBG_13_48_10]
MAATLQILVFSTPENAESINPSSLMAAGYDIAFVFQPPAVEEWLKDCPEDALLVMIDPSASNGLKYAAEILRNYPFLPIILVTSKFIPSSLKQALEIGLYDYLIIPVDPSTLLQAIERSQARQKHLREWIRYSRIFAELKDGMILTDMDGRLLLINQSARDIFQLGTDQIEGKPVSEVIYHPDLLDIFRPHHTYPYQSEISLENGHIYSAQSSLIPQIGIAVVMQEITHLKELDRIKTDFVNTVSHDLRSPLTAIYGFVGLIDRVGPINEQQAEFIRHIQSSVQNITSLINDLLELGRIEADYDLQMKDVDLNEIVSQSVETLDYQVNEKMQQMELSFPPQIPRILGNPLQLQRMVTNLIENAIKFTPAFGKINVSCRSETNQVFLEVADNGPGIPLEDQPRIFDKFYRGSNLSQNTPGTGLGLSIVKSIVEKHHGRIWLESSPTGTTFTVILPIK